MLLTGYNYYDLGWCVAKILPFSFAWLAYLVTFFEYLCVIQHRRPAHQDMIPSKIVKMYFEHIVPSGSSA